jgi:hypothetical protein
MTSVDMILADEQLERFALGLLVAGDSTDAWIQELTADHFTGEQRIIVGAMIELHGAGKPVSVDTVGELVRGQGISMAKIYECAIEARDAAVTKDGVAAALERYRRRRAVDAMARAANEHARDPDPDRFDAQWKDLTENGTLANLATALGFPSAPYSPSLQETNRAGVPSRWLPLRPSELGVDEEVPWIWSGFLARGCLTLLTGIWKGGKTTLLGHLVRALDPVEAGDRFIDRSVIAGPVLIVTEESKAIWKKRCQVLGLGDHVRIVPRPFLRRPTSRDWEKFVNFLAAEVRREGYVLVIFDTISTHWPVVDENDAGQVKAALAPIAAITEAGAAALLVHHPSKGDGTEGRASRGSGALPATVDIIVELRRYDPQQVDDCRRVLSAWGRFDEIPAELVIAYDRGTGYRALGARREAAAEDRLRVVVQILEPDPWLTVEEILAKWPDDAAVARPGARTIRNDVDSQSERGRLQRHGGGRKGDPHRYALHGAPDSFPATTGSKDGHESQRGWLSGSAA